MSCEHDWTIGDKLHECNWVGIRLTCYKCNSEIWASCDEPSIETCERGDCQNYFYPKAQKCECCDKELTNICAECCSETCDEVIA